MLFSSLIGPVSSLSAKARVRKPQRLGLAPERLEERTLLSGFNFVDFSNPSGLDLLGDASITPDGRLRLNPAAGSQRGAAWYTTEKQYLAEGFWTTFQFQMTDPSGSEGMAFVIQNSSPSFLGGDGEAAAYNGLSNSIVFELDTYHNADVSDPSSSHISVHTGGSGPNSINETFSLGSYSTNPVMDDGAIHSVKITYTPGTFFVFLDNFVSPVLTVPLDLTNTLDLDWGRAWVGFTASTGGGTQIHDVLNWQIETPAPPATVLSTSDASVREFDSGTANLTFTITRAGDTTSGSSVNWATGDGTATAGSDYVASSGEVMFLPGETAHVISVAVNGDAAVESHETVLVQLSSPTGSTIVDSLGIGTILNDETTIAVFDTSVNEGKNGYAFLDTFVTASDGGLFHGRGVAFGPDGNLYLGHYGGAFVPRFDGATGAYIDVFANGLSDSAQSSQVLFRDGFLFVASSHGIAASILRFDAVTGAPVPAPGKSGAVFASLGNLGITDGIHAFAFGPDGNLYISDQNGDDVLKYDGSSGTYLGVFVPAASGGLDAPVGLTFGPDGHLYVGTNRPGPDTVLRFQGPLASNPGAFIGTFVASGSGGLDRVASGGIWFRPDGDLYVTSGDTSSVLRFSGTTGAFVETVVASGEGGLSVAGGHTFDDAGLLYVNSQFTHEVIRYVPAADAALRVSLAQPTAVPVSVNYATGNGSASGGSDFLPSSGTVVFAPGETTKWIFVKTMNDTIGEPTEIFFVNLSDPIGATIADGQGTATILDNDTKFYVVNDSTTDQTFEYASGGVTVETYNLGTGNTAPRGAASNATGTTVWVADANKKVYVYNPSGGLLGSWTAGSLHAAAQVEGVATNGTDVWLVDNKTDKVLKYTGAASRLLGSQNAASSFNLASGNNSPKDIVTDGVHLWVVNDSTTDKVFKYTVVGSLVGSWTISTSGAGSPTGITLDPTNVSDIWIVDSSADRVFQYTAAASRLSGSQSAATSFALAAGNTNPQGIADPPSPRMGTAIQERPARPSRANNSTRVIEVDDYLSTALDEHVGLRSESVADRFLDTLFDLDRGGVKIRSLKYAQR